MGSSSRSGERSQRTFFGTRSPDLSIDDGRCHGQFSGAAESIHEVETSDLRRGEAD